MLNRYTKELEPDEIIPIWFDKVFKLIFGDSNHLDRTKLLISSVLKKDIDSLELLDNELIGDNRLDKINSVDLLAKIDDEYVHIEVNSSFGEVTRNRNLVFLFRVQSKQLKSGDSYRKLTKHYQINFNQEDFDNEHINICHIKSENTGKIYSDFLEIYNINVKHFADMCYNGIKEEMTPSMKLFALIGTDKKSVIDNIITNDNYLKEIGIMAKDFSSDDHILMEYNKLDLLRADMEYEREKELKEQAQEITKKVTEQVTLDNAKKMIDAGIDIDIISKILNIPKDVLENL